MDAHLFRILALELTKFMRGGRVEKIYSPAPGIFALTVYNYGFKRIITMRHDKSFNQGLNRAVALKQHKEPPCIYWSDKKLPNPEKPSTQVMTLRKYIQGRRLGSAHNDWVNRRIFFYIPPPPDSLGIKEAAKVPLWLSLDLINGPHLVAELPQIDEPVWPDFAITGTDLPALVQQDSFWRNFSVLTPALRRTIAQLDNEEAATLLADLSYESENGKGTLYSYSFNGKIQHLSLWPLPPALAKEMEETALPPSPALQKVKTLADQGAIPPQNINLAPADFCALNAARELCEEKILQSLGLHLQKDQLQEEKSSARRLKKTLQKLNEEEQRLKKLLAAREQAILLQSQLWRFNKNEKLPFIVIENSAPQESDYSAATANNYDPNSAELSNAATNSAAYVKAGTSAGKETLITLDPKKTVLENMEHMFKQAGKGERGLEYLQERRASLQAELAAIEAGLNPAFTSAAPSVSPKNLKSTKNASVNAPTAKGRAAFATTSPKNNAAPQNKLIKLVQQFTSSDGFIILRGKSAAGNHALLKLTQPHDLWLHVQGGPSAHVVIRRQSLAAEIPEQTLREAGTLSALKSWRKHDDRAEIISALVKDVRPVKGGAAGSVLVSKQQGSFVVQVNQSVEDKLSLI